MDAANPSREERLWLSTMLCRLITGQGWDGSRISGRQERCYRNALRLAGGPLTSRFGERANVGAVYK